MSTRRAYIDWARALAVLLMIEAHTLDAWTRVADRRSIAFRDATVLGGFAAPLFLWLAGIGVVLSATRTAEKTGSRALAVNAICRRGAEIFILAFLFRLQAFVISPGSHPVTLFRVDILNVMGPAIAVAGLVWGAARSTLAKVVLFGVLAAAMALATPIVRDAAWVDALPTALQWYIRPAGEHTTFTGFPWAAFVFAGGASGALIVHARDAHAESRLQLAMALAGALLVAGGFYAATLPSIYAHASFWTSSPTWFAIRVGVLMLALAAIFPVQRLAAATRSGRVLTRFGQSSLFVYWIHVELVYGYASWLWRGRLPLWGTAAAAVVFSALMYGAVVLRDRVWKRRKIVGAGPWGTPLGTGPQEVT